ncbi:hypothetical protein IAD21_03746 [Abditibacteriota bacterium]|nr:hypothetical protein IAD21_03746 [Abditibacteriota bacterium]
MHNRKAIASGTSAALLLLLVGASLAGAAPTANESAKYTGLSYKGKPALIPGTIQAEEYDIAPEAANGITFNYNNPATKGPLRTSGDSIGLARFGDGHVTIEGQPEASDQVYLGWTHEGEWLKYTVHVDDSGLYSIGGHFSAANKDSALSFTFSPTLTTGPITIPTTAGYQPKVEVYHVWETRDALTEINLPKGDYVLTVKIEKGSGLNLDNFTFTKVTEPEA